MVAAAPAQQGLVFEGSVKAETFRELEFEGVIECLEYCTEVLVERTTHECLPYFELPNGGVLPGLEGPIAMTGDLADFDPRYLERGEPVGYELRTTTEVILKRSQRQSTCSWDSDEELVEVLGAPNHLPPDIDPEPECNDVYKRVYETVLSFDFVPCA